MKTNHLLLMAMTALLTASCSQNEVMEVSPDVAPPVGFNVYATAQTRGTVTDNTALQGKGFGVLAYYTKTANFGSTHKPNFMYNQEVTWNTPISNAWGYTPVKYWPNADGDKISFFAYAPYESAPASGTDNGVELSPVADASYPTLKFTVNSTASKMKDLVATHAKQTGTDKTMDLMKTTGKVKFNFKHVLTKLNFKAKLASDLLAITNTETQVFVRKIELLGTSAVAGSPAAANSDSKLWEYATYKFEDGTWDYTTTGVTPKAKNATTSITLDAGLFAGKAQAFGPVVTYQYKLNSVAIDKLNDAVPLFKTGQSLYLIPPTNAGIVETTTTKGTSVRVLITYDVVTIDDKLADKKSVITTQKIASLPEGTMKPGVAYNYTFTIGIESVKVDAKIDNDWTTTEDVAIPSAEAVTNDATGIKNAIATLNTTKGNNPNCNYFVVNVTGAIPTTLNLSGATVAKFKSGDKIEIKATAASNVTSLTLPATDWMRTSATSSADFIIIQKK